MRPSVFSTALALLATTSCAKPILVHPQPFATCNLLEIYYAGFGAETFSPVGPTNIESEADDCQVTEKNEVNAFVRLLSQGSPAPHSFSDARVRLKVYCHRRDRRTLAALVDNEGVVRDSRAESLLATETLQQLKNAVEAQCWSPKE